MARRKKSDTNPTTGSPPSSSSPPLTNSTIPVVRKSQRQIAKKKLVENMSNINVQNPKTKSEVENNDDNQQWRSEKDTENLHKSKKDCNDTSSRDKTVDELVAVNLLENNLKIDKMSIKYNDNNSSIDENNLNKDHINCNKIIYNVHKNVSENGNCTDKITWSDDGNEIQHVIEETIICEEMQVDDEIEQFTTVKDDTTIEVEEIVLVNEPPFQDEEVIEYTIIQNKDNAESIDESDCTNNIEKSDRLNRFYLQDEIQDKQFSKCSFINNKDIELVNQTTNNIISVQDPQLEVDSSVVDTSEKKLINDSLVNLSESSSGYEKTYKVNESLIKDYERSEIKQIESNVNVNKGIVDKLKTCNSNSTEDNTINNPDSAMFETYKKKKKSTAFYNRKNLKSRVTSNNKDKEFKSQNQLEKTPENTITDLQMTSNEVQINFPSSNQRDQSLPLNFVTDSLISSKMQSSNSIDKVSLESNKLDFVNIENDNSCTMSNRSTPCNDSPINSDWDNNIHNIESKLQNFTINKITNNVESQNLLSEQNEVSKLNNDNIQSSSSVDDSNVSDFYNSCSESNSEITKMDEKNCKNLVDMKTVIVNECQKSKKEYFTGSSNIQTAECDNRLNENNLSGVRRSNRIKSQSLMRQKSRGRGLVTKPGLSETVKLFNNQESNENIPANNMSLSNHSSINENNFLIIDNQSETQSDKENNVKIQLQNISESSTSNTASNNSNTASISNTMVGDYNTGDSKKPVKVKSRWRRSSELEMGNSISNRLSFGDIVTSGSEFSSLSSVNINESFNNAHFVSKNSDSIPLLKCKEEDLVAEETSVSTSFRNSTNDLNSFIFSETSNIDKAMSSMVIDQKSEKQLEEKRKKYDKKTNTEIIHNNDDNDKFIGNGCDNVEKNQEEQVQNNSKNLEMVLNDEDERELRERLSQFEYLKENLYLTERYTNKETKRMICDCFLTEEEIERGELGCGEDCLNRLLMIECGSRCTINDRCTNKRFQNCAYAKCQVFKTKKKGFGLRATADLPAGEFIMEYVGEVVNTRDFRKRAKEYSKDKNRHYYFMALKSDQIIDATMKGNISRFINHSCDPNAETQKWTVNGELRIGFFNRRFIAAGEEITFDYHFQRYGKEAQKCYCESTNCRGWIGDTPEEEKEKTEKKEKRVGNSCTSGGVSTTIVTTGNSSSSNDKTERERDTTVCTKKKRNEAKAKVYFEDEDLEEEIEKLCTSGLKNRNHTLTLSRLMVRCREMEHRTRLLRLIQNGEQPCRRLFLDYHGLRLIWSYMMDIANIDNEKAQSFKLELLKALNTLPIPNKTMLMDSKVYNVVEKWSKSCLLHDNPNKVCETQPEEDVNTVKTIKKENESTVSTPKISEEVESNCDSNDNTSISCADVDFNRISEQKKSQETTNDNSDSVNIELNIQELASNLLNNWSNLKEVFRIPKKERIEQMKEHEREADDGYRNEDNGNKEELKRESCLSSMSSYEKHRSDRYHYGSKKEESERNRERCSGDHHHHHHHHHSHNHTHNHHHHHHHRSERLDKRKNRDSPDLCSDQTSYKFKEKRTTNDERTNLVPVPRLTKFERRQLFALKVAKEEEEERIRKQQQELWQQHEARCLALSMNPHTTAAVDPQTGYPLFFNAMLGQWQSYPIQEDMCDIYHNGSTPMTNDQQIQPTLQPVEIVPSVIPQYTSAVTYTPLQTLNHQPTEQPFVDSNAHFQGNIIPTHTTEPILMPIIKEDGQLCLEDSMERQQFKEKEETENDDDDENGDRKDKRKYKRGKEMNNGKIDEEESYFIPSWRNMEVEVKKKIEFMGDKNNKQKYFEQLKIQEKTENGRNEQIEDIGMYEVRQPELSPFPSQINSQECIKETNIGVEDSIEQQSEMPMLDLPPKWKCAKDSRGRFYYYHIKDRISQWLPPPPIHIDIQHDSSSSSEESSDDEGSLSSSDAEDILEDPDFEQIEVDGDSTKDDKDFLKRSTEKMKISTKLSSRVDPLNLNNTVEMKRKRDKLVQERIISPRRESDQVDYKKYKDTKEKLRKRKERVKLKEQIDKLKKHRRVNKTKSHAKHTAIKLQAIAQSNELTAERKIKDTFRINMANVIVKFLNPYRQNDCKLGRITNTEDFKYLARKLTHFVLAKELKHCKSIDELHCNDNVKHKAKDFVRKYMNKFGPVYQRLSDED
ncbi:probable histone-lysine N-methyltransferase CG1716 isoform X2 [Chelonus insularis]|uniref:probable histone-lysine N-methyltransferase CG1716 isoform X2 n=1 Tax=Chelonus insularis TaxID=460826 RepID=UPI00158ED9A0|nr:probable histone-lysine N-methyltransferase CG1716 isoform X2 [Chelonus insularis]